MREASLLKKYSIRYTRHDPVYGKGWVILYYSKTTATRQIKAKSSDDAVTKLIAIVTKDHQESKVEIAKGGIKEQLE